MEREGDFLVEVSIFQIGIFAPRFHSSRNGEEIDVGEEDYEILSARMNQV